MNRVRRTRRAFTLLELLLVLSIVVMIGAIATPNLARAFKRQTLKKSGDVIRAEWSKARVRAMTLGRVEIFRCTIGGNQFRTDTWVSPSDAFGIGTGTSSKASLAPTQVGVGPSARNYQKLPDGIAFLAAETLTQSRDAATDAEVSGTGGNTYERRIYFYPDGSCSTAQLVLQNRDGHYVVVELRGLTGISRASDVKWENTR